MEEARAQAKQRIQTLDPYAYVNTVEAQTDDLIDLSPGAIHHSWEEDNDRFPDGNLVYEVQVDVPDDKCSMRGFDKGKVLDDGSLRPTHVADYLAIGLGARSRSTTTRLSTSRSRRRWKRRTAARWNCYSARRTLTWTA